MSHDAATNSYVSPGIRLGTHPPIVAVGVPVVEVIASYPPTYENPVVFNDIQEPVILSEGAVRALMGSLRLASL